MNRNLTATILIILAIGIYFTVTTSILADADKVKEVNNQYVAAIESADKLISVRDQVTKDYNNLSQDDRERLAKIVPGSVDNIRLVIDLNSVAMRHGFALQGIKATAATPPVVGGQASAPINPNTNNIKSISTPTLDTVSVSFGVTAPYLQFISFLQDLEANLRIMDITHLSITSSDTGVYSFQVQLKTYWLRQQ